MRTSIRLLAAALLLSPLLAHAHSYQVGELKIGHPWSREMPPVAPTAAAYFVVENQGNSADRLLSASTPVAAKAEIHEHTHADGLMKMQRIDTLVIPPGGTVKFAPMGYHVMLFNLKQQAKDGERFPLTLNFEKAGPITVEVAVERDKSEQPAHSHAH